MKKKDETLFYIGNFLKDITLNICDLYPLMIVNKIDYSKKIPKQWGLSAIHQKQVRGFIADEFTFLRPFYDQEQLKDFLLDIKIETTDLRMLMRHIPFMTDFGDTNSIFNGEVYEELMEYFFFTVLCKYTTSSDRIMIKRKRSSTQSVESVADKERGDINEVLVSLNEEEKRTMNEKICELLIVYIHLFETKKGILDINNKDITERILKQKEREKNKMTARLSALTIEEREVENELKKNRLGVWSKGLTKGLFQYSPENWDSEFAEIEITVKMENQLGQQDEVTAALRGILKIDIEDRERTNARLDAENYGMSFVRDSEDGDGEQVF